jgi:hypothetical protein
MPESNPWKLDVHGLASNFRYPTSGLTYIFAIDATAHIQ